MLFPVYINSFIVPLNAQCCPQLNAYIIGSSEVHVCHSVYCSQLHIKVRDEGRQALRKNAPQDPDHEELHPALPVQAVMVCGWVAGRRFSCGGESP
ncbi:hypothetical protein BDR03DRAFT_263974 [Suillus americanus]|nr:hypothetical protein BDR03DRAFT_263974 [Suillus americanus]